MSPQGVRSLPKLTDSTVADLMCPAGKKDILVFDDELPGFGVRVTAAGKRIFIFQYRELKAVRRMTLGIFGAELTTAKARSKAQSRKGQARDGKDPALEKRKAQEAALLAAGEAKRAAKTQAYTLRALIEEWDRRHLSTKRAATRTGALFHLNHYLKDMLDSPASGISRSDAVEKLDALAETIGPYTARSVMAYARAAYNWARKRDKLKDNPFQGLPSTGATKARDRALSEAEVSAIWKGMAAMEMPFRPFFQILLLTGQRRTEVAEMRWSELSADGTIWTIPAERAKNGKAQIVHLAPAAQAIIKGLPRFDIASNHRRETAILKAKKAGLSHRAIATKVGTSLNTVNRTVSGTRQKEVAPAERTISDFVFTTTGESPLSGMSSAKKKLDAAAAKFWGGHTPIAPWVVHDCRRTIVTWLAGNGVPPHVCDRLLNHLTGAIQGVAAIYQKQQFLPERKAALEKWAAHLVAQHDSAASCLMR
jgi:integrase